MEQFKPDKKKLLIVDNDAIFAKTLERYVLDKREVFYDIFITNEHENVVKLIKEIVPDLVILEVNFASINAIELYRKVAACDPSKSMKVMVLTKRKELEDIFLGLDVDSFIPKTAPFDVKYFLREIDILALNKKMPILYLMDSARSPYVKDLKKSIRRLSYKMMIMEGLGAFMTNIMDNRPTMILIEYDIKDIVTGISMIRKVKEIISQLDTSLWRLDVKIPIMVFNAQKGDYKTESISGGADYYLGYVENISVIIDKIKELHNEILKKQKEIMIKRMVDEEKRNEPPNSPT